MSYINALVDTWNAIGTTYNSIYMNASNGAGGAPVGAAASRIFNLLSNGTTIFDIDISGNVTPQGQIIAINGTNSLPSLRFAASPNTGIYSSQTNYISFTTANIKAMTINDSQQVGIGTGFPSERLTVNGNLLFQGATPIVYGTGAFSIQSGAGQNTSIFANNGASSIVLYSSGGLSINTANDPGAGMIYTNSATFMIRTKTSYANGVAANLGTLTNAPAVGNPTKWIPIDDNGTTRFIPAW